MERKSASAAMRSAVTAAAGVSIMTPSSSGVSRFSSRRTSSAMRRTSASSATLETIGTMIRHWPAGSTPRMARSWVRSRSGCFRLTRTPRRPSAGFCSCGRARYGAGLSAPTSRVRTIIGRPSKASAMAWYCAACSVSAGGVRRSRNRNSVRSRPQPSAPLRSAAAASAGAPMLANTSMRTPSAVRQGVCAAARAEDRSAARAASPASAIPISAGVGADFTVPASASRISKVPSKMPSTSGPAATRAGRSMAAARMAMCEVGPPPAVQTPAMREACRASSSEGVRSSAITMAPSGALGGAAGSPLRAISTCRSRSFRSAARSARRGSPRPCSTSI